MKLYGKNPVLERLRSNPKSIKKIHVEQGVQGLTVIRQKAKQWNIPVIATTRSKMQKIGRSLNTQGIVVVVDDFEYMPFDDLLEQALKKKRCILFLDEINDPQNLGAIIRSAGCLGHFSIVLPSHKSVSVTEAALRVASGGESHVAIAKVSNLNQAIREAKGEGFHIVGTVVNAKQTLEKTQLPFPLGIVVGSEQKGIRDVIRKNLDLEVQIPMYIDRLSFNVAHATTILCYEVTRQKLIRKKPRDS